MIIIEATKIRPYLTYIKNNGMVVNVSRKSCTVVKETLDRKPTDTAQNTINFVNTLFEEELKTMGIKDMLEIITWERKAIGKNHHIESVEAKEDQMLHQVKYFKGLSVELLQKGLPSFWDEDGKLISESEYQDLLVRSRLDHKMFEDMTQYLP